METLKLSLYHQINISDTKFNFQLKYQRLYSGIFVIPNQLNGTLAE